jgi:hypothetical protein
MRLTPTTRLIALAVLLLVATGIIWWGVGFHLGSALLDGASAWRSSFAYGPIGVMRLFALAIVALVTVAVVTTASQQTRWLAIAALAFGAVLLYGDRSRGDIIAVVMFVLGAVAVSETAGRQQVVVAVAAAIVIAFAGLSDRSFATPQKVLAVVVRAIFFYTPLLLGPTYLERYALPRTTRG